MYSLYVDHYPLALIYHIHLKPANWRAQVDLIYGVYAIYILNLYIWGHGMSVRYKMMTHGIHWLVHPGPAAACSQCLFAMHSGSVTVKNKGLIISFIFESYILHNARAKCPYFPTSYLLPISFKCHFFDIAKHENVRALMKHSGRMKFIHTGKGVSIDFELYFCTSTYT